LISTVLNDHQNDPMSKSNKLYAIMPNLTVP